jgi:hypothetical protein
MAEVDILADEPLAPEVKAVVEDPVLMAKLVEPLGLEWIERFDQHKLKYVLDHLEEFKAQIMSTGHDFVSNPDKWKTQHIQLTYLDAAVDGEVKVKYHQTEGKFGRLFANRSVSLQGITRAVRHTPDLKTPYLNHYIRDRNAVIEKEMKGAGIDKGQQNR